jgi:carotenoid cleavage dioxygenase
MDLESTGEILFAEKFTQNDTPWSHGAFAPVHETNGAIDVVGLLPTDIDGVLLRNGPNPIHVGKGQHWFDGEGMTHSLRLVNGSATYASHQVCRACSPAAAQ